jgi:DNA-binding response OmpR family regulator
MTAPDRVTVLAYSQLPEVRTAIVNAVGRRAAHDLARIEWVECANYSQVKTQLDSGDIDLAIFDGDAQPTGGLGLSRQFKNEIDPCPPILVTLLRRQDRWLAAWSQADGYLFRPFDPVTCSATVAATLRAHAAAIPHIR